MVAAVLDRYRQPLLYLSFVVLALFLGLGMNQLLDMVAQLGYRIPQYEMAYDYSQAVLWALGLALVIGFVPLPSEEKRVLFVIWGAKCCVTLVAMLVYEWKYGLDAYIYFQESTRDFFDPNRFGFGWGTSNIAGFSWYLNHYLPVGDSYHALKVIYSFIGLAGVYVFYRGCSIYTGKSDLRLLWILGFFPSILFWSSILGKDPITTFGIGLYAFGVLGFLKKQNPGYLVFLLLGLGIATSIRVWSGLIFLFPLASTILVSSKVNKASKFVATGVLLVGMAFSLNVFKEHFAVQNQTQVLERSQAISRSWSHGGSGQEAPEFKGPVDMLLFSPVGMFTAIFRPLPGEVMNMFGLLSGAENFLLLLLVIAAIRRGKQYILTDPGVVWAFSLVLFWAFVYGFVSYQNLGSAVRFKLQILPILLAVCLYLISKPKSEDEPDLKRLPGK